MKKFLFITCVFILHFQVRSDSPLTSTDFWLAYQDVGIIIKAQNANGLLNDELCAYLIDEKNPIDIKMAVINCLSWSIEGKRNSVYFLKYVYKYTPFKNEKKFKSNGKDYILLCYAYLKAMDNYFNVYEALEWAKLACDKNKNKSFTFAIIRSLIEAQIQLDINWCNVFIVVKKVIDDKKLERDIRQKAIDIIWEYISLYQGSC